MAEYFEREAAVKAFNNFDAGRAASTHSTLLTPEEFAEYLYELPAADVAPVVHGHWISLTDCSNAGVYCSICHKKVYKEDYAWCNRKNKVRSSYCPNCGAKMDGGDGDAAD